jgi:hypothetical protein
MEDLYSEKFTADTVTFAHDSHHDGRNEEDETQAEQQSDTDILFVLI